MALAIKRPSATALMLALTFSTGVIDAVGYLGLDKVFTGNMTGNVVILAMALTGADGLPIAGPLLALAGFGVGAAAGGRLLRGADAGWNPPTTRVFVGVAGLLTALAALLALPGGDVLRLAITTLLGVAMGAQAAAARHIGVKDVTTVVVTSTVTALFADSRLGNGSGSHWRRRGTAVALIMAGAAVGALLLRVHAGLGVALAALVTGVVAWAGHRTLAQPALVVSA